MSNVAAALSLALTIACVGACKSSGPESAPPDIPPPSAAAPLELSADDDFDDFGDDDFAKPTAQSAELAAMTLPPRPDWADKYANPELDERFFDVTALMQAHQLDRAQAVELQNHFRDLARAQPSGDRNAQYAEALRRAKEGVFEDGHDPERWAKAPFIVVFDLDSTLLDQYMDPKVAPSCHDIAWGKQNPDGTKGSEHFVKLAPGWDDAFRRIAKLGGLVVLYTANTDDLSYTNAAGWRLDDQPILKHPAVGGMLTNSHLVLVPKKDGTPVVEPSKDLRLVDPDLTRAIIVDDNPRRLFQFRNVRVIKKFDASQYCTTKDRNAKKAHDQSLKVVVDEVEDSLRYMKAHPGTSFVDAYLPYSALGQDAVRWLQTGTGRSEAKAVEYLRTHPELVDQKY
ncbi:NIF family HAD-type phosphatase [Paraliomyxa miuraensis]|uniref:NIF family HAD-type phosphatase n=1 Tax=Paraliomyxa miuraensis TaxID=376150 RepID=UPI00224CA26C|nr:NIF family HAD-type phosphatase [Paraliomyxa miuraensis]MCX4240962.1 HAD family hydrolase [Paraliomyxa miuraensis]